MTADEIKQLCRLIPVGSTRFSIPASGDVSAAQRWIDVEYRALRDPRFGFNFIRTLIETGTPFPLRAKQLDQSLLEMAYIYERMAAQGHRPTDGAISEAHFLARPENRMAAVVNAYLLQPSKDFSHRRIANATGFCEMGIRFYETLFFNVRDRAEDPGYIFWLIWPHGRYSLYGNDYTRLVPDGQLLLQMADEFGLEKALAGYGFLRGYTKQIDAAQGVTEAKHVITGKALSAFWAGQSNNNNRDIGRHTAFVIAEAQSGGPQSGALENVGMTNLGDDILDEIRKLGAVTKNAETPGTIIDVTPEAKQLAEKT